MPQNVLNGCRLLCVSIQACEDQKENEQGRVNMADDRKSNQGGKKQGSSQQGGGQEGGSKGGGKQAGSQESDKGNKQGGGRQSER